MRITGGTLRSRRLQVAEGIRPTQDRVREAVFSALGEGIAGTRVLDLFAGTGALGLEAWSRGARSVCCVEKNETVCRTLRENIESLCGGGNGGEIRAICSDCFRFLERDSTEGAYDLVLADPPYAQSGPGGTLELLLRALHRASILPPTGLLVYEQGVREPEAEEPGWTLLRSRKYGKTRVLFYRPVGNGSNE